MLRSALALGLFVIVWVHVAHIKQKGWRRYFAHYKHGVPVIAPFLNAIEELVKPFTLALRLFGNIFAGEVLLFTMLALTTAALIVLPLAFFVPGIFLALELLVGAVQAMVFALLAMTYISLAIAEHQGSHDDEHEDASDQEQRAPATGAAAGSTSAPA